VAVLLVLIVVAAAAAVVLCIEMSRRDKPGLGLAALGVLIVDGILGTVYAALASI
jgi:hypothetical protein